MADDPPPASLKDDSDPSADEDHQENEEAKAPRSEETNESERKADTCQRRVIMSAYGEPIDDFRKVTYRDFSHIKPTKDQLSGEIKRNPSNKEATFPMKLHIIVSSPEFPEIQWLPHGRSWRINNPKSFEERVIPVFFRHGRYTSFARQVNGWGFRRITHGNDFNSYYHELFLRGMPHLCERMKRLTNKDPGTRKRAEEEKTPDFVAISKEHPLPESAPMLPPSAIALSSPSTNAPAARSMTNYLNALSQNGGVESYIQSLSDAEISFLARRQMQMPPGAMQHGAPPHNAPMHPGMMRNLGMMGGGMPMGQNPGVAMRGMFTCGRPSSGSEVPHSFSHLNMASDGDPRMSMQSPLQAAVIGDSHSRGSLTPPSRRSLSPNQNVASRPGLNGPFQQGNLAIDQYLNRGSDNELAQLIAMHEAGRRQQEQYQEQQQQEEEQRQQFRGFEP